MTLLTEILEIREASSVPYSNNFAFITLDFLRYILLCELVLHLDYFPHGGKMVAVASGFTPVLPGVKSEFVFSACSQSRMRKHFPEDRDTLLAY